MAGVVCYRTGHPLPILLQAAHLARAPGRAEGALLGPAPRSDRHDHIRLGTPVGWCRDNLNVHLVEELADFAAAYLTHLTRVIKRKLKKIQYRPHLVDGCPPPTGPTMDDDTIRPPDFASST
jgi:hypothetical protein